MLRLIAFLFAGMAIAATSALADEPAAGHHAEFMASYRAACPGDAIYASCADQAKILADGLKQAQADKKLAVVIFGFNSCPPCKALDLWMKTDAGKKAFAPYELIEVSIFDPQRKLRPEVFATLIPSLKMPINNSPPYGVPSFAIVDPVTKTVLGKPITGFDADDQSEHLAYLSAHAKS